MSRWLQNTWYPVALTSELPEAQPFARRLLDHDVVFFRRGDGQLVALQDRCPHRFAPLSGGVRVGDDLACPYHGLRFGPDGRCTHNPHGDGRVPQAAVVRSFPVCERHGIVWWWPGPGRADAQRIPDLSAIEPLTDTAVFSGYLHTPARDDLIIDNLLDLTHADFLHSTLLGTNGAILPIRSVVTDRADGGVHSRLLMSGHRAPGLFQPFMPDPEALAEMQFDITWWAPGIVSIVSVCWQGDRAARSDWPGAHGVHLIAPQSATSSHYSFVGRRNFLVDDAAFTRQSFEVTYHAFACEDKPMLAAQQARIGAADLWSMNPVLLSSDAAAVRVRRRLAQAIEQEEREEDPPAH